MSSEFNIEAVVGTAKSECLWLKVVGAIVEVWGGVEGWVEEAEGIEFRAVGWREEVFDPPAEVFALEVGFERGGVGGYGGFGDVLRLEEAPSVIPP